MTIIDHAPASPILPPANPPGTPKPQATPKPKGEDAAPEVNFWAGQLAEQNHMLLDLDADSKYPVPPTMRNEVSA